MLAPLKPVAWLHGCISSPPFSPKARHVAGYLLCRLQLGELLSLPESRPVPVIGPRCHELRIRDDRVTWRVMYRLHPEAVVVLDVFAKTTRSLPHHIVLACRQRCIRHDASRKEA